MGKEKKKKKDRDRSRSADSDENRSKNKKKHKGIVELDGIFFNLGTYHFNGFVGMKICKLNVHETNI